MDKQAVMISIRPQWCELIANGRKTVEVRKTRPKLDTPFKCYIYQTLPKHGDWNERDGRVIGEFTCNEIDRYAHFGTVGSLPRYMKDNNGWPATEIQLYHLGMRDLDLEDYGGGKPLYGWHISDLVIYDEPKPLKRFQIPTTYPARRMTPPQSWCYAEELDG